MTKRAQDLMGEANLRYARHEVDDAIHICMEVIKMCRSAPEPYQTAAMIFEEEGEQDRALQVSIFLSKCLHCYVLLREDCRASCCSSS